MANENVKKSNTKSKTNTTKTATAKKSEASKATTKKQNVKTSSKPKSSNSKSMTTSKKNTNVKTVSKPSKKEFEIKKEVKVEIKDDVKETKPEVKEFAKEKNKAVDKTGLFENVIIIVAVALVFSLLGYFIGNKHNPKDSLATSSKELQTFIEQYNKIVNEYYKDVDKNSLIKGAMTGMLSALDEYSQVIDDSSNNFNITLEGVYEGIGVEVVNDDNGNIVVYNTFIDSPAAKAGLYKNDIITKINDKSLKDISTKEFVNLVKETEDIKLTVLRDGKEKVFNLKKERIVLKSVSYEMINNSVGYIKIDLFANNTKEQFEAAVNSLEAKGMKKLIIDLRDNTGGHLSAVKDMLSLLMDSTHVIYQTESKTETIKFYSDGNKTKEYKIVVLQNEVSASASEIMASALQEQLNAYIIGKHSFGKGTVQQLETVDGIGQYKFTTKKWLTSNGTWIEGKGVMPDLEVNQPDEYYKNPTRNNDLQLNEAIKYLK